MRNERFLGKSSSHLREFKSEYKFYIQLPFHNPTIERRTAHRHPAIRIRLAAETDVPMIK